MIEGKTEVVMDDFNKDAELRFAIAQTVDLYGRSSRTEYEELREAAHNHLLFLLKVREDRFKGN